MNKKSVEEILGYDPKKSKKIKNTATVEEILGREKKIVNENKEKEIETNISSVDNILNKENIIKNEEKTENITIDSILNKRNTLLKNKEKNLVKDLVLANLLDFFIFGLILLVFYLLKGITLIAYNDSVIVFDNITFIVLANLLLISYFYFYVKDNKGSTIGMKLLNIKFINDKKEKQNTLSIIVKNIVFYFYFIIIDVTFFNSLEEINLNIFVILVLILQIIIIFYIFGIRINKLKIKAIGGKNNA